MRALMMAGCGLVSVTSLYVFLFHAQGSELIGGGSLALIFLGVAAAALCSKK